MVNKLSRLRRHDFNFVPCGHSVASGGDFYEKKIDTLSWPNIPAGGKNNLGAESAAILWNFAK